MPHLNSAHSHGPKGLLLFALMTLLGAPAAAAELSAEQIVEKALAQGAVGVNQGKAVMRMSITNARGEKKDRTLAINVRKDDNGLLNVLVKFQKPAEVAGIAFLVREKKDQLPDQYVYIPASKVVRRVAAGNASSSFFGSDFSYGDLMPLPASDKDKVGLKRLPDVKVGGQVAYVVEATPKVEGAPYGKVTVYVHKKHLVPLKVEYFDPGQKPLKTLSVKKLKKVEGKMVPVQAAMKNLQKGTRTDLVLEQIKPNAKFTDADFTEEAMQR
jgi:outer membrane lipoprotein-sorting protein